MKSALRGMVRRGEKLLAARGYKIEWAPQIYLDNPQVEVKIDLEFIISHLLMFKRDIFFIEIGANDGKQNDPLWDYITTFSWRGLMVEPIPEAFRSLEETYGGMGGIRLINAAITERNGTLPIYTIRQREGVFKHASQFSSFRKECILGQSGYVPNVDELIEQIEVPCMTFDALLELVGGETVDILQIDTEGYDGKILDMINLEQFRPVIINYEHVHMTKHERNLHGYRLAKYGYRMFSNSLDTCAYLAPRSLSWRNR